MIVYKAAACINRLCLVSVSFFWESLSVQINLSALIYPGIFRMSLIDDDIRNSLQDQAIEWAVAGGRVFV